MFNDALWRMSQQSRRLQELRREIEGIWDDNAARELNTRYLHPHQEDDLQMGLSYREQQDKLGQAQLKVTAAQEHEASVERLSSQITDTLDIAEEEMQNAHRGYDLYLSYQAESRSQLPLVQDYIRRANSACP